jgi:hypothetical protein
LKDRKLKTGLTVQVPRALQMGVVVYSVAKIAPVRAPALAKIYCAPDIDFAVAFAAYLVDA